MAADRAGKSDPAEMLSPYALRHNVPRESEGTREVDERVQSRTTRQDWARDAKAVIGGHTGYAVERLR